MEEGKVIKDIKDGIAEIVFYHPKSNSLPSYVLADLAEMIMEAGNDDNVKVIVLRSEGNKAFCAGASFDELISINDFDTGKKFFMGFANVINAMRKCPKFIISRVQGKSVGGGVGLIAASDYAFGVENASIKLSELSLGIGPFVVGPAVERKIGKSAFSEMSIDFEWHSAEWAMSKGFYNDVFLYVEALDEAVKSLANKLSSISSEAIAELKKVLWSGTENWDELLEERAEISGKLVMSEFTKKFIQSFKEKNK